MNQNIPLIIVFSVVGVLVAILYWISPMFFTIFMIGVPIISLYVFFQFFSLKEIKEFIMNKQRGHK